MSLIRRITAVGGLGLALVLMVALPASASLTGPCSGSATIAGVEYDASFDSADNPIVVPEEREGLVIPYEGGITVTNTNYLGAVGLVIGPATVNIATWGLEENDDDIRSTNPGSQYRLGSEVNDIVGLYQLTAFHDADGGNCDATAMVKLEGNPLSTPLGLGVTAGTVISAAGLAAAGMSRKP
ncbi:MAG: hypothetical protein HKN07_12610 [Acidimicrobiia bacterium]|nr:hypothetical protein [Acidimicrobiia bacterium]